MDCFGDFHSSREVTANSIVQTALFPDVHACLSEAAIMCPKCKASPINGDAVRDADLQREKMKIDISALPGGDVHAIPRERSERAKSRFSKGRDADEALKERQQCLVQLAQSGGIAPAVLMSLPAPEEIARRAEKAKAKAQAALAAQNK
jgi:hypothetical protein